MSSPDQRPAIRGACPGAHTPFLEADGALVRVRIPGGALSAAQLRVCAGLGGGTLEITSRANLQVRGLDPAAVPSAVERLIEAGLVLPDPARDERRNVLASPTAGFDTGELIDTRPVVAAVAQVLAASDRPVSPKFGVLVDGGGAVNVRGRRLDVCLGARHPGLSPDGGGVWFEMRLDEPLPISGDPDSDTAVVPAGRAADAVAAVLDLCPPGGRAVDIIERHGRETALRMVAQRSGGKVVTLGPPVGPGSRAIGVHTASDGSVWCGVAPVLGRLDPVTAQAVADLADRFGSGQISLTPWRGLVLSAVNPAGRVALVEALSGLGLSADPGDPVHQVVACAGRAGCQAGMTDTQVDGARLVARLRQMAPTDRPGTLHLSGCPKSCATREATDVTLVGGPRPGEYEVYRNAGRRRSDGCFGTRVAEALSPEQALVLLCGAAT